MKIREVGVEKFHVDVRTWLS